MTRSEHLRLSAALAHAVPGAELHLVGAFGDAVVVASHPGADLTACQFRAILLASHTAVQVDAVARIRAVRFDGAVREVGGGVLRTGTMCGSEQRWVATTLPWRTVVEMLDELQPTGLPDEAFHANVKPDSVLGVVTIAITSRDRRFHAVLDQVAEDVAARLMTEELVRSCTAEDLLSTPKDANP